jgi:hypothetical protein
MQADALLTVRRDLEQAAKGSTSSKVRNEATLVKASAGRRARRHMNGEGCACA